MDMDQDVSTVLATIRQDTESLELINLLYQLEDYYERKLWHQLTQLLKEFYHTFDKSIITPELKQKIYTQFIADFQLKLNHIKLVDFLLESFRTNEEVLDQLLSLKTALIKNLKKENNIKDNDDDKELLDKIVGSDESVIYIDLQIARYYLKSDQINQSETILDKLSPKFDSLSNNFNSKINAAYYLAKLEYNSKIENYNEFYSNGLLYLSSTTNLSQEDSIKLCYELCIAALLGDKIYNFGELILHDILKTIETDQSQYNWLFHLIQNLNSGNLKEFNKWCSIAFEKSPMLRQHELFLKQKIIIMGLLELISTKSTTNKQLSFKEISEFTGTPLNDVEHLIIKCFSLNLIKGYINQIDETLIITWLQPRILNLAQVKVLYDHLIDWDSRVEQLGKSVYENGGTVWAGV